MRVGISGYVGDRLTGIGRVLISVLQELAVQNPGSEYIIFKNFDFSDYDELRKFPNISIVDVPYSKKSGLQNILWHQWKFQSLLKEYKCDLAYIPNFTLLLRKVVPTIVTIHDLIEFNVPEKFSKLRMFYRKFVCDPLMARRSDHILTVSQSSYNDIVKYLGVDSSKITLTLNATDKSFFRKYPQKEVESIIERYGLEYKKFLLFVGTIDFPGKNIKTVVESFLNLKGEGELDGIKLVVIGKNGYNSEVIYDIVENSKYSSDIVFTGYLEDGDLPKFYAGAAIMLYLSFFEGFGLPVLEAMSCATSVICPNTSCFPEIVEGLDVSVSPTDVDEVERKILRVIKDEDYRKELEEKCYERSLKYSWKDSAQVYQRTFENLLKK